MTQVTNITEMLGENSLEYNGLIVPMVDKKVINKFPESPSWIDADLRSENIINAKLDATRILKQKYKKVRVDLGFEQISNE